jgi:hypothetical protein
MNAVHGLMAWTASRDKGSLNVGMVGLRALLWKRCYAPAKSESRATDVSGSRSGGSILSRYLARECGRSNGTHAITRTDAVAKRIAGVTGSPAFAGNDSSGNQASETGHRMS